MEQNQAHQDKRWYLVSYDIRDPKRWRGAYKLLQGNGERIQFSMFRCRLNKTAMEQLRWELEKLLSEEDDLMFVHLCPRCATRIQERGKKQGWKPPENRFDIV